MLILSYNSTSIDLSRYVSKWQFDIEPSFSFNEMSNGTIYRASDMGNASDKYYSDLELSIPFKEFQDLITFYNSTFNNVLSLSTDLDLFFPNKINSNCVIVSIEDNGYFGDIFTRMKNIKMRLYLTETQTYSAVSTVPQTLLDRGIWEQNYDSSNTFNVASVGVNYFKNNRSNNVNTWTVEIMHLKRTEAQNLLSWILGVRTNSVQLTRNNRNANLSNSSVPFTSVTSYYNIRDFDVRYEKFYCTATLTLIENADR